MRRMFTVLFVMTMVVAGSALAKSKAQRSARASKSAVKSASKKNGGYSTSHSFDGARVKGRVQEGSLRRIVVENDKSLDDLLGVRKNFDDRSSEETERNLSW